MRVAVIPARGGSKRIPRKNIRQFAGRPMIAWSIETALTSGLFDQVVVSTDDDEIAAVAVEEGAVVPFRRPPELSDDYAQTKPVVAHAVSSIEAAWRKEISHVCCIYPTAPFLEAEDLVTGWRAIAGGSFRYAFAVTSYAYPVQRALRRLPGGGVEMLQPGCRAARSQDLEQVWHDAGQFYFGDTSAFIDGLPVFDSYASPVVLPRWRVHDIDTQEDWVRAELVFQALRGSVRATR